MISLCILYSDVMETLIIWRRPHFVHPNGFTWSNMLHYMSLTQPHLRDSIITSWTGKRGFSDIIFKFAFWPTLRSGQKLYLTLHIFFTVSDGIQKYSTTVYSIKFNYMEKKLHFMHPNSKKTLSMNGQMETFSGIYETI